MPFHRWTSTDCDEHDACLTCGGMWINSDEEFFHKNAYGDEATPCTGDVRQVHGFPGERHCDECDAWRGETCPHMYDDCNCLFCDS